MWSENDERRAQDERPIRSRLGSEVAVMDERAMAAAASATPPVANLNVSRSSRVHIGPKFVSVTQNVTEVVEGRFLGLGLVSPKETRRLRCSVAVFVCWAFIVASALAFFLLYYTLTRPPNRLDIDLPLRHYLWNTMKSTSKAERLICLSAVFVLSLCIFLIIYFTVLAKSEVPESVDVAPDWNITREMWLARPYELTSTNHHFEPLMIVIIDHTVSSTCTTFIRCAAELRNLQSYFLDRLGYDIPYNFLIGNDGRIYEGRGWGYEGAHTPGYNRCSLGIGFIGNYGHNEVGHAVVTEAQVNRTKMLLEASVERGVLHPNYVVLGGRDLRATESPGSLLYAAIQEWEHYDHQNQFRGMSCEQIQNLTMTRN